MLRPERMSRVSVTGTKRVMDDAVEAIYDLNLLHLEDYDGSWEGFSPGDPMDPADETSERLVTVRSIESILGVDEGDVDDESPVHVTEEDVEEELSDVRAEVNELDDRRSELREELRDVEERVDTAEPFSDVGIDLDLLSGYDSLAVEVGDGDREAVEAALAEAEGIDAYEVFAGEDALAIFVHPADEAALDEALVGVEFAAVEVPDAEGAPGEYLEALEAERERIESEVDDVQDEIESLKVDAARFLLAAEERLSIEVQKAEAPLRFATTENAFLAEGWIPTDRYDDLEAALSAAAGDLVEVEELERADYAPPRHGHGDGRGDGEEVAADGGTTMGARGPPVVQENPVPARPFELLVETISKPQYWNFDPTVILFLTFPLFFGFMIGDLGYGILYAAVGYWMWSRFDSDAIRALGGIAMWAGGFTALFGILYGEIFGLHLITEYFWVGTLGLEHPPIEKGLSPAGAEYARAWLFIVMLAGLAHVTIGYIFGFAEHLQGHGLRDAVMEKASWVLLMLGAWTWILSTSAESMKPEFIFTALDGHPFPLGFAGFSAEVGLGALVVALVGLLLMVGAEYLHFGVAGILIGVLESLNVLVNILSYARIAAVLLAKAGMAFVVNLLFFGVYAINEPQEYHFMISHGPAYVLEHEPEAEILFPGLIHFGAEGGVAVGILGLVVGLLIIVFGHLIVLALGITSAGLQAVRLEYVEFFSKFYYEGGAGEAYEPFGSERRFSSGE